MSSWALQPLSRPSQRAQKKLETLVEIKQSAKSPKPSFTSESNTQYSLSSSRLTRKWEEDGSKGVLLVNKNSYDTLKCHTFHFGDKSSRYDVGFRERILRGTKIKSKNEDECFRLVRSNINNRIFLHVQAGLDGKCNPRRFRHFATTHPQENAWSCRPGHSNSTSFESVQTW